MRPLFSVVIPAFDAEEFLPEALSSVLGQSFKDFEVIVVDDGSTDGTPELLRETPGIRVLRQDNSGVAAACNRGVEASRGTIVSFLEADDIWSPEKLETEMEAFRNDSELAYTVSLQRVLLKPGVPRPDWLRPEYVDRDLPIFTTSVLSARSWAFKKIGVFSTSRSIGQDTDWFLRARHAGLRSKQIHRSLVLRRIHGGNLSYRLAEYESAILEIARNAIRRRRAKA